MTSLCTPTMSAFHRSFAGFLLRDWLHCYWLQLPPHSRVNPRRKASDSCRNSLHSLTNFLLSCFVDDHLANLLIRIEWMVQIVAIRSHCFLKKLNFCNFGNYGKFKNSPLGFIFMYISRGELLFYIEVFIYRNIFLLFVFWNTHNLILSILCSQFSNWKR